MKNLNRCLILILLIALIYILNYYQETINKKNKKKDNIETENFQSINEKQNILNDNKNIQENNSNILERNRLEHNKNEYDPSTKNKKNTKPYKNDDVKKKYINHDMLSNDDSLDGISQLELDTFNNSLGSSFVPSIFDESEMN